VTGYGSFHMNNVTKLVTAVKLLICTYAQRYMYFSKEIEQVTRNYEDREYMLGMSID
jgi:hypothetical protein